MPWIFLIYRRHIQKPFVNTVLLHQELPRTEDEIVILRIIALDDQSLDLVEVAVCVRDGTGLVRLEGRSQLNKGQQHRKDE